MRRALVVALAVASVTVTACDSDTDEGAVTTSTADQSSTSTSTSMAATSMPPASDQVIPVSLKDFMIMPMPMDAKAGSVTFKVTNGDPATHNFWVEQAGTVIAKTKDLQKDGSEDLTVDLKPGTYDVYCQIPGHASLGMKTTLTVT